VEIAESEWAVEVLLARDVALVPILGMEIRLPGRRYRWFASTVRGLIQSEVGRIYFVVRGGSNYSISMAFHVLFRLPL
jgi:hypothetical protein